MPTIALEHWKLLRREKVVYRKEVSIIILLSTMTVAAEAAGLTLLLPVLSYVEHRSNIDAFVGSSRIAETIYGWYRWAGIEVNLLTLSAAAMAMVLLRQTINYWNSVEIERIRWNVGRRLAVRCFELIIGSSALNITSHKSGQFLNAADYECQATAAILRAYGSLWMQLLTLAAFGGVLFVADPDASIIAGAVIVFATLLLSALLRITNRLSKRGMNFRHQYASFLMERFRAWKLIKLNNTLSTETDNANELQRSIVDNQIKLLKISGLLKLIFVPLMSLFLLASLYIFVEILKLEVAIIMTFALVLIRLMPVAQNIQAQLNRIAQFMPSYRFLESEFNLARKTAENLDLGSKMPRLQQTITFRNVSFRYSEREAHALNEVSISIPAGGLIAIVGSSGAGKSTFVDLIPRLIEPDTGEIEIDGRSLTEFSLGSIRRQIAYVPQEPFLFDASVAENVRYGRPEATRLEIEEAIQLANAAEFVDQLPLGMNTSLGSLGDKLSGGQRQRIVLARAFLTEASLLVLDEPTSALDYESEAEIKDALDRLLRVRDMTIIVVTHRLSTVRDAAYAVHLENGRVVGAGTPAKILAKLERDNPLPVSGAFKQ